MPPGRLGMFGIGHWWVLVVIVLLLLIIFGPGKLGDLGGALGRTIREFRKASKDDSGESEGKG